MRPTLRVKVPSLSTMIMFLTLLPVIPFSSTSSWRGMLFYLFGAFMLFHLFLRRSSVRWGHLVWLLAFYLMCYLSQHWALYPVTVIRFSGYVRFAAILSWAVAEYVTQEEHDLDYMCKIMLVLAVLLAVNFLFNAATTRGRYTLKVNANTLGVNAAYLFGFVLYAAKKARWRKLLLDAVAIALVVIILLTGSRKALIMVALFVVAYSLFWTPEKGSIDFLLRMIGVLALIVAIVLIIMNVGVFYDTVGNRVESLIQYWMTGETTDASAVTRNNMINIALELFLSRNPLFGIGLNNFKFMSGYMTYSHNNYVELLCGVGIVGVLIYYVPLILFTIWAFLLWRKRVPGAILPLSILVLQLINDVGQVSYYSFSIHIFLGIAIGYVYLMGKQQKERERKLELEQEQQEELLSTMVEGGTA